MSVLDLRQLLLRNVDSGFGKVGEAANMILIAMSEYDIGHPVRRKSQSLNLLYSREGGVELKSSILDRGRADAVQRIGDVV